MPQNQAQRLLFVSGKGGVGKSLIAAALASENARLGKRVLLVEIGDTSYYKDFWRLDAVGHEPIRLPYGFDLALWSSESCLREYVLYYLKLERLYQLFFENKVMSALIGVAPGLNEVAILGKITSGIRKVGPALEYDLLVIDCYATGHALALLQAPKGMMEAIKFGPMGHHSREMEKVLENPDLTSYKVVTLLEEMPVIETLEFRDALKRSLGAECEVIANKVLTPPVGDDELAKIGAIDSGSLGEFARYLASIVKRQDECSFTLRDTGARVHHVPLVFSNDPPELVSRVGEALRQA